MAFGKRNQEEIKKSDLKIWECSSEGCKVWIRDNFKSEETPTCPVCKSEMESTVKELQIVDNNSAKWK